MLRLPLKEPALYQMSRHIADSLGPDVMWTEAKSPSKRDYHWKEVSSDESKVQFVFGNHEYVLQDHPCSYQHTFKSQHMFSMGFCWCPCNLWLVSGNPISAKKYIKVSERVKIQIISFFQRSLRIPAGQWQDTFFSPYLSSILNM